MGPAVATRRWHAETVKKAIADDAVTRLADAPADEELATGLALQKTLAGASWLQEAGGGAGFGDVQPATSINFPAGRTEDEVFAGFNQLWRRNIRKAEKSGVEVVEGTRDDLPCSTPVYVETGERDGFTPRGLSYFQRMWDAMNAEDPQRLRLYLARHGVRSSRRPHWSRSATTPEVLLRRLHHREPQRPPIQRGPVAHDHRQHGGRMQRLRSARDQ